MEVIKQSNRKLFELSPKSSNASKFGGVISQKRSIIGRSQSCDIVIDSDAVSSVHAVLEVRDDGTAIIFDMDSTNGTYVNGQKVVTNKVVLGDTIQISNLHFTFKVYAKEDLPPVLDSLELEKGEASILKEQKVLPTSAPGEAFVVPQIVYPLSLDPKAEFSEYIFEYADELQPIFDYQTGRTSAEIIILYDDVIFGVDYLPVDDGTYHLVGHRQKNDGVEYPYISKDLKVPLVDIRAGDVYVHKLSGYNMMFLSDSKVRPEGIFKLERQDIVRFEKNGLQIFIRSCEAPPKVKAPPFFRKDKAVRLYVLFALFVLGSLIGLNNTYKIDEEIEQSKIPERIAKVLYIPKKLVVTNDDGNEKKNEVVKKIEEKVVLKPTPAMEKPKEAQPQVEKVQEEVTHREAGEKSAKTKEQVKQATVKDDGKRPEKLEAKKSGGNASPKKASLSNNTSSSMGHVDTYKSFDFSGSVSNTLAKGKGVKGAAVASPDNSGSGSGVGSGTGAVFGGSGSADNLKRAETNSTGSLVGASTGKLTASKGAEGLSAKKGIMEAGFPTEAVVLGMDPNIIRQLLREAIPQFKRCYQSELDNAANKEEFTGIITLNFVIGASGSVTKSGASGDSTLTPEIKNCVINVLKGIPFPEPPGGGTVEVKQPINFYPKRL